MSKPARRKPRKSVAPPLPPIGHYVLAFQAPDGTLQPPPIPLDQRFTDAELREVVEAVQAKLLGKLDGTAKEPYEFARMAPSYGPKPLDDAETGAAPASTASRTLGADTSASPSAESSSDGGLEPPREATPRVEKTMEAALGRLAEKIPFGPLTPPRMTKEEADSILEANGIPPAAKRETIDVQRMPLATKGPSQTEGSAPQSDGEWAASMIYRALCLFSGASLIGCGIVVGSYGALKMLPTLDAFLGQ
jgi:hypothetical protein